MPIQVPVVQTGLEQSIQQAAAKAGKNLRINMGPGAKSIESLSKPLGRLTGKADEFTKSMEAANARVLAFGASVGVIAAVSKGLQELVKTTIEVEKSLANINSILRQTESQLDSFKNQIFDIARNTGQTFDTVAEAALELSRQGLKAEEVTKRLNDALVLSRLSGLSAADSVAGLTAAVNSFSSAGLTTTEVLNKISAAAASAAVSDRDLIEGLKRSGAVAVASGVQFDELIGIISALQERTARGGAVIGNSLKTIFTRIQDIEKLNALQDLGVQVTDLSGQVLSSNKIIENLAPTFAKLDQASKVNLADNLVGKFQIAPFLALLEDYNLKVSRSGEVAATSFNATNEAYQRNEALSKTLASAVNAATVNLKELANALGEIGVTDSLRNIIGVFNSIVSSITDVLDGDGIGSQFAKGLIKGVSAVISGPGLALALVAIGKLLLDFAKFGAGALKTFFGLNKAAEAQKNLQGQIAASLLNDKGIRSAILSIEKQNISEGEKKKLQTQFFTKALNEQLMVMQKMQGIARTIAPGVMAGTASRRGKRAAGGFLPIGAESSDISRGVGGAPASAKPVVIPNFAFGGGKRGTMVANDSEYIVPNYANGGDAIFNQNMASSMGLPANARKVRAAGGYIPNFAKKINSQGKYVMMHGQKGGTNPNAIAYRHPDGKFNTVNKEGAIPIRVPVYGLSDQHKGKDVDSFIKDLELYSYKKAIKEAKNLSGGQMPNPIKQGSIKAQINKGSVAGFAGSIYELALATLLTDEEFLSYASQTDTSNFDLNLKGQNKLLNLYGIKSKPSFGEVKGRNNPDNIASAAAKIYRVSGLGQAAQQSKLVGKKMPHALAVQLGLKPQGSRRGAYVVKQSDLKILNASGQNFSSSGGIISAAASGYIPNFAEGALEEAIGRERAAGLPVSQIRINQSGKLRNAQNPMGLAVTNTRDEPTGAIPNFNQQIGYVAASNAQSGFAQFDRNTIAAQKDIAAAKNQAAQNQLVKQQKDLTGIFFAVSAGMTALEGATAGAENGVAKFTNSLSGALQTVSGFAFAGAGISQAFAGATSGIGKFASKLGPAGLAIGAAVGAFQLGKDLLNEFSGENSRAAKALANLTDVSKKLAINFDQLSEAEKADISLKASKVVGFGASEEVFVGSYGSGGPSGTGVSSYRRDVDRSFTSDEVEKGFIKAAESFLTLGKSTEEVDKMLDKFGKNLDAEELKEFTKGLKDANAEFIERRKKTTTILSGFSDSQLEDMAQGKAPDKYTSAELSRINLPADRRKEIARLELKERRSERDQDIKEAEQINFRSVQNQIKTRLEIFKIQQKSRSEAEKELLLGEKLNTINLERKQELQNIIAGEQEIEVLNSKVSEGLVEQISNIKGITSEKLKSLELDNKINAALKDGELTSEEALKILDDTADSLAAGGQNIGAQKTALQEYLKGLYERFKVEKGVNATLREGEQILERSLQTQKDFASRMALQTGLTDQSSQSGLRKNIRSSQANIRLLEREAEFATPDKLPGIQKQIISERKTLAKSQFELDRFNTLEKGRGLIKPLQNFLGENIQEKVLSATSFEALIDQLRSVEKITSSLSVNEEVSNNFSKSINDLIEEDKKNREALKDNTKILGETRIGPSAQINSLIKRSKILEDAGLSRRALGLRQKANVIGRIDEGGDLAGLTEEEATAKIQMSRGVFKRIGEDMPTALENSDKLRQTLADGSLDFAHNIGNAMLDAIQKGENLGDVLLGTAAEFLNLISRAFMKSAVNDLLGSFGVGKQGGGPISGGSGTKDDVPAMLMGGEFVMNKKAVRKYGMGFMSALNNGSLQGFASGGQVKDREGMFTTPGMNGAGAIKGAANLLSFATQTPVALNRDTITSSGAFLDAESGRMTMFGRRNNPQFQKVQDAKRQAFDLYASEMNARQQAKEQEKANKKALMDSLKGAAISAVVGVGMKSMAAGFKAGFSGTEGSFGAKLGAGLKGTIFGGNDIAGQSYGGLSNLFTGRGFQSGPSGLGSGFTPKSASAIPSGNSAPLLDLYEGARLGGKITMLPKRAATGGLIPAAGGVDTVPAMLSGGEFVMNAAATRNIGAGNLQALNSGAGVDNTDLVSKLDELILATEASQSTGEINITVNGSNGTDTQTSGQDTTDQQRQLSERIKVAVKQVIADEQRLGGQLRR
jgi:TP901 family phage tail tape measure protein